MAEEEVDDAKKRIKRVQLQVEERRRKEEYKTMVERVSTWLRGNIERERGREEVQPTSLGVGIGPSRSSFIAGQFLAQSCLIGINLSQTSY